MTRIFSVKGLEIESGISNTLSPEANAKFNSKASQSPAGKALESPAVFSIILDHLPYRELSPNAYKKNWWSKHPFAQAAKQESYWLAINKRGIWQASEKAVISYVFTVTTKRVRDIDNLISMMKPYQDGLVDAGIILKDDCWHLSLGSVNVRLGERIY